MPYPFIDIHTHNRAIPDDTVSVRNLFPGEDIPAFKGETFSLWVCTRGKSAPKVKTIRLMLMIEEALDFDHVLFVGECGIDKRAKSELTEQIRAFKAQAFMAEEYEKPLMIHCESME